MSTPQQDFSDLLKGIKEKTVEVVRNELIPEGEPVEGERIPQVPEDMIFDPNEEIWSSLLESDRDLDPEGRRRVHTVMLGMAGLDSYQDDRDRPVSTLSWRVRFVFAAYVRDLIGDAETSSSEQILDDEVARTAYVLATIRQFDRFGDPLNVFVKKTSQLNERRGTGKLGEVGVRQSIGDFWIYLNPIGVPRP